MQGPSQSTKNPTQLASESSREPLQNTMRQYLRQTDEYIAQRRFPEAKLQLQEAKKLDARNPYIAAFEERIALLEGTTGSSSPTPSPGAARSPLRSIGEMPGKPQVEAAGEPGAADLGSREALEQKIRQELETEYRTRFTTELRKAEELAAKIVADERSKLEQQRVTLKAKYDQEIEKARQHLEQEYLQKLDDETLKAGQRLEEQHRAELAFVESELKAQMGKQYEEEQRKLQECLGREKNELLEQHQTSLREQETALQEQYNRKLLDALRKAESVFREQNDQQRKIEEENLRQQLREEFTAELQAERSAMNQQYEALKASMEASYAAERQKVLLSVEEQLKEQLDVMRQRDRDELERKRNDLRTELEAELRREYERRLDEERSRIHREGEAALEAEKQRLGAEHDAMVQEQTASIQKLRVDLRAEMEETFLHRLEQIAREYDHKMELLGATVPVAKGDRLRLYRERMRACYGTGEPSVDSAGMLMELKELLELTFDEHLAVESDVRLDLYVATVGKRILAGELNPAMTEELDRLKQQFHISSDEAQRLEPYILSSFQRLATKGRILVADDDTLLLTALRGVLTDAGYQVLTAEDVSRALDLLKTNSVDLILSDIKFLDADLDGFKFFRAVQEQPHLRNVPFVLMSALSEGVIVRSGVQLGVDDYLVKPMDPDLLIAVIEGKLKRYRSIQLSQQNIRLDTSS